VSDQALFEAGEVGLGAAVLALVLNDHESPVRSMAMMPFGCLVMASRRK
jgi:hypothetical protein